MIDTIQSFVLPAAFSLLPPEMDSDAARVMMLAIGLQESQFECRTQLEGGPARGFWMFEPNGGATLGVLTHKGTRDVAYEVLAKLQYKPTPSLPDKRHSGDDARIVYAACGHNDILACCFARLLLWTLPHELPQDANTGWVQYKLAWRPGKPRPHTWEEHFNTAWELVYKTPKTEDSNE